MKQKLFLKILPIIFILLFSFTFSSGDAFAQNSNQVFGGQAVQSIEGLSDPQKGLMPCDPYSENKSEQCSPKDAVILIKKLGQVSLYVIIISLFLMLVIGGLGYVYKGKSPQYLIKWKKYIKNSAVALLLIVIVIGLVLGILAATNFDSQLLDFLRKILAETDFSIFNHAYAQEIPTPTTGEGGEYANFFPGETVGSLILKIIQVLINYIVAPALVLATIWAGFLFIKAEGNPQKLTEAKKFALRVVVGIVVAAAAATIVTVILNSLNEVTSKVSPQNETVEEEVL